jgi:hypothetical protein
MRGNGYTRAVRFLEASSMVAFLGLIAGLALRLRPCLEGHGEYLVAIVLLAYVAADLVSGLVHWMGDTWGTPEMAIVGRAFIRPFREHHVDQLAVTRHDFIEVNGASCLVSIPVAAVAHIIPFAPDRPGLALLGAFFGTFLGFIFATNQFHKWAHMDRPPWLARCLQRCHLILPAGHHQVHHTAPHDTYYCITVGWLNEPLRRLRFFSGLDHLVQRLTAVRPRQDEIRPRHLALHDGTFLRVLPSR